MRPFVSSRHLSLVRNLHLADVITLSNAACGVGSIFCVQQFLRTGITGWMWLAMALLPMALLCDFLDGTVARARGSHGVMGRELDSLSDVISFGVAPAMIAHALGMDGLVDVALLLFLVACGVARLARFNVTAESLAAGAAKVPYFEGTPITFSLLLVGMLAACLATGHVGSALPLGELTAGPVQWHPLSIVFAISGCLMVSRTLRVPKP